MKAFTFNDVNVYDVSSSDEIELLQDLSFPTSSCCVDVSRDGEYVVAAGTYKPALKLYDVQNLSMKCERRLNCEKARAMVK